MLTVNNLSHPARKQVVNFYRVGIDFRFTEHEILLISPREMAPEPISLGYAPILARMDLKIKIRRTADFGFAYCLLTTIYFFRAAGLDYLINQTVLHGLGRG